MSCLPARSPCKFSCASEMPPVPLERSRNQRLAATPSPPLQLPGENGLEGSKAGWERRPRGGSCHVSPTRPSRPHQSGCKRYPSRRNPSSKSSSVSCSSVTRQKPLAVLLGGSAQSWLPTAGSQHPFQTADAVIPSWFSEANANCFLFLSSFRASLRSFITLCPASTGHEAELLSHFISRVCL